MNYKYIAGFFDGEGTITVSRKGGATRHRIIISQANLEVLEEIKIFCKMGEVYKVKKRRDHWKESWIFTVQKEKDVLIFLKKIIGFLIVKKESSASAILFLENKLKRTRIVNVKRNKIKQKALSMVNKGISYRQIERVLGVDHSVIGVWYKKSVLIPQDRQVAQR